ncbi:hypothetical protein JOC75_002130 [Metabacillus crassostreae]|nr:hypothetical protein [Metabacillus crassostreae]MBM7604157.1 hypothetical protein [Metabacillus crassostreae]
MEKEREIEISPTALNPLVGLEINEELNFVNEEGEKEIDDE